MTETVYLARHGTLFLDSLGYSDYPVVMGLRYSPPSWSFSET